MLRVEFDFVSQACRTTVLKGDTYVMPEDLLWFSRAESETKPPPARAHQSIQDCPCRSCLPECGAPDAGPLVASIIIKETKKCLLNSQAVYFCSYSWPSPSPIC